MKKAASPTLTHLDKVFWPKEGYTKGDVIAYYERMAKTILPYLKDRPMVMNRTPDGIRRKGFYQKNTDTLDLPAFVKTVKIHSESTNEDIHYVVVNNKETLLYLANLGVIEMNPWLSRVGSLDRPDFLIFDIDPSKNPYEKVVEVARAMKRELDRARMKSYVKTSGKTGMHIYVPLGARYSFDESRAFAEQFVKRIHARLPKLTTLEHTPAKRRGKIYLDWLRNAYGQTCAAPYSLRPFPGATVSAPLEWKEVKKSLDPSKFTIETIGKRFKKKGDLWKPVLKARADLKKI